MKRTKIATLLLTGFIINANAAVSHTLTSNNEAAASSNWKYVGETSSYPRYNKQYHPEIVSNSLDNKLYMNFPVESNMLQLKVLEDNKWNNVGGTVYCDSNIQQLQFDATNQTPYLLCGNSIHKLVNGSWQLVKDTTYIGNDIAVVLHKIAFDKNNRIFAVYSGSNSQFGLAFLDGQMWKNYDGGNFAGIASYADYNLIDVAISPVDNQPYVSGYSFAAIWDPKTSKVLAGVFNKRFIESDDNKFQKYNLPSYNENYSFADTNLILKFSPKNHQLYSMYGSISETNSFEMNIAILDGNNEAWTVTRINNINSMYTSTSLTFNPDNDLPYVSFSSNTTNKDNTNTTQLVVSKLDNNNWVDMHVLSPESKPIYSSSSSIAYSNHKLYLAYLDKTDGKVKVINFDDTSSLKYPINSTALQPWSKVGMNKFKSFSN